MGKLEFDQLHGKSIEASPDARHSGKYITGISGQLMPTSNLTPGADLLI